MDQKTEISHSKQPYSVPTCYGSNQIIFGRDHSCLTSEGPPNDVLEEADTAVELKSAMSAIGT